MADADVFLNKAQRSAAAARKAQHIGEEKMVKKLMTSHPAIVKPVLAYAKQLVDAGAGHAAFSLPVACVPQDESAQPNPPAARPSTQTPLALTEQEVKEALSKPIARQYPFLNRLPVADLKNLLRYMEPILFSGFALQGLAPRGKRSVNKDMLAQLISYVTGLPFDQGLEGTYSSLLAAAEHMSQLNVANGNIGHSLSFPLSWEENGHYKVTEQAEPGYIVVHSKQLGDSMPLSLTSLGFPLERKLLVQKNWDEHQAILKCQENPSASLTLFMAFKGMAGKKRPMQMLDDLAEKRSAKSSKSSSPPSTSKASSTVSTNECMSLLDGLTAVIDKEEAMKKEDGEVIPVPAVERPPQSKPEIAKVIIPDEDDDDDEPLVPTELAKEE
eukprot:511542-Amphidinium_carterae.3